MTAPAARPPARAELLCVRAVFTRPGDALVGTPAAEGATHEGDSILRAAPKDAPAPYRRTRPPPCP
ncbi:hypothetical protein [Streptomyces sp. NPDC001165]|uniref:hypothetical protein n=1 Tax=Streptomyces sp. NPDC001165 TaxID=3364546 RepID=UPI0036A1224C